MARLILSSAIAFSAVMTVFASAAEACISCQHTPVVVRGSQTSNSAQRAKKRPAYSATKQRRTRNAKKRVVKRKNTAKKRIVKRKNTAKKRIVKRPTPAKKVETVKIGTIMSQTDNQNSTISTASLDKNYVGCKSLSVACVVGKVGPSEMSKNIGRLIASESNQLTSGRQESPTLTRGAFANAEQ